MAEQRLIDANALEFEYDPIYGIMNKVLILGGRNVGKTKHIVKTALKQMIDNAPTIDAVEVIRCKDCAHSYYEYHGEYLFCKHEKNKSFGSGIIVCPNHFCGYGERKDTDGTK